MEEDLSGRATRLLLRVSRMCFKLWSWCEADGGESKRWSMRDESMKVLRMVDCSLQFEESNPVTNAGRRGWVYRAIKNVRFWEVDVYRGKKKVNWKPSETRKPFPISRKVRESKIRIHSRAYVHILIVRDLQSGKKNELEETAGEIPSIKGNPETYCANYEFVNHGNLIRIVEYFQAMDRRESSLDTHSREPFHLIETAGSQAARGAKLQSETACTLPFPSWMSID